MKNKSKIIFAVSGLLLASLQVQAKPQFPAPEKRLQYILISFDGTPSGDKAPNGVIDETTYGTYSFLSRLRTRAARVNAGYVPSMTLFINSKFLTLPSHTKLTKADLAGLKNQKVADYLFPSDYEAGGAIKFEKSPLGIENRALMINKMKDLGVEIGAHSVTHLKPSKMGWGAAEWKRDFKIHKEILAKFGVEDDHIGIRAPFLDTTAIGIKQVKASLDDPYFQVLRDLGYRYDTSKMTSRGHIDWPSLVPGTNVREFPVPQVKRTSGKGSWLFFGSMQKASREEYKAVFEREFNARYNGTRAPLLVSGHGERIGETTAILLDLCFKPNVRCGSFKQFMDYLDGFENAP